MKAVFAVVALVVLLWPASTRAAEEGLDPAKQWGWWRGPLGTGVAPHGNPPLEWSETKNVKWKVKLPGKGHASPIVWGDVIIVQSAVETDKRGKTEEEKPPERRPGRRRGMPLVKTNKIHKFVVTAVSRKTGRTLWETTVREEMPEDATHPTGTWASNSPVTDGEHLISYFGSRGLHCLDMEGKILWQKDLGVMKKRMSFGEGSSPALHKGKIVVVRDHEGQSFIAVYDKKDGKELWRADRNDRSGWATPLVVEQPSGAQIIVSATRRIISYDLDNGKILWDAGGMTQNVIPTPMEAKGIVYLMSGFRGSALLAIRLPKSKGDMYTADNLVWSHGQNTPYTPSGCLHEGYLYFLRANNAILSCHDAKTGKAHFAGERFQGLGMIYSSLVAAKDLIFVLARNGQALVFALGPECILLAQNTLQDGFSASPAIVGEDLILRGEKNLYCIREK
jgi:outer membrane protein assembly factor BamB